MTATDPRGRDTVRELARRVAEHAHSAENTARFRRWTDVNSLRLTDRPPVICHPGAGVWDEVLPERTCVATDSELRGIEYRLRQQLFKWELGDDTVLDAGMPVSAVMRLEGEHFWGLPVRTVSAEVDTGGVSTRAAWRYDPPLREESDIERIVPPRYRHDRAATEQAIARMHDLLGDILPVRQVCGLPGPGAWLHGWATELRGVEPLLYDLMDRPQWVHRLMGILRDGFLGVMDQFEQSGLLTLNNTGIMACADLPPPDRPPRPVRLKHLWGRGESQEFQGVSPAQYEEFLLRYQKPILERFGITYYGCCEDLTNKIGLVLSIPNLRRFVCSAWTDLGKLVEAVGTRYSIEWRQKASDVVFAPDLAPIRQHLERGLRLARGSHILVVLQELETVNGNPRRLAEWAALVKDIGARGRMQCGC
jgi:hypothetical protein